METAHKRMPERMPVGKLASYSAGTVILRLTPGEESVALVFNIVNQEMMMVPKGLLSQREYRDRVIEMRGDYAVVSFDQRAGLGTPFGKDEPEDNGNRRVTAERETLEETGAEIGSRIIERVSYTEQPNRWAPYSNTVFLANGIGFAFDRPKIRDPLVDPRFSGFYFLARLPLLHGRRRKEKEKQRTSVVEETGTYYAAIRRIVATLLQLDKPLLTELGRPGAESAEDLALDIIKRLSYFNLFSQRTIRMFVGLKREDLLIRRLASGRKPLARKDLAEYIGKNVILWTSGDALEAGLEILLRRVDPRLRKEVEIFLGERIARKESSFTKTALDKRMGEIEEDFLERAAAEADEEEEPAEDGTEDYRKLWLAMDLEERQGIEKSKSPNERSELEMATTPQFFACIGQSRTCRAGALPGELTCLQHRGEARIALPGKVLIRMHFAQSSFGQVIVDELMREGVPLVERTKERQSELELARMFTNGVRVFGNEDIGPNVIVQPAVKEMESMGYVLTNVHVLSLDDVVADKNPEKVGSRTVVFCYEYGGRAITATETAAMLFVEPFMSCRVWVNIVDSAGTQIHAVELTAYQHGHPVHHELQFAQSIWAFRGMPRPEKKRRAQ